MIFFCNFKTFFFLGNLPAWVVNKSSKVLVPKVRIYCFVLDNKKNLYFQAIKKLTKACTKYDTWKSKNQPSFKPWLHPEQMSHVRLNPNDIGKFDAKETLAVSADTGENMIREQAMDTDEFDRED